MKPSVSEAHVVLPSVSLISCIATALRYGFDIVQTALLTVLGPTCIRYRPSVLSSLWLYWLCILQATNSSLLQYATLLIMDIMDPASSICIKFSRTGILCYVVLKFVYVHTHTHTK
jgi:hypothetical protein